MSKAISKQTIYVVNNRIIKVSGAALALQRWLKSSNNYIEQHL